MSVKLTPLSKAQITTVVVSAVGAFVYRNRARLASEIDRPTSNVPPVANLPDPPTSPAGPAEPVAAVRREPPGCLDKPEVRFYHWAWNAQAGLMLATGGKQATAKSLVCQNGVNLKLIREDNTDQMQSLLATFAEGLKRGEDNPAAGAHFVAIMWDGSATFLKALNDRLTRLGPDVS